METTLANFRLFLQSILDEHTPVTRTPGAKAIEAYTGIQQDKLSWFKMFLEDYNERARGAYSRNTRVTGPETDKATLNNALLEAVKEYAAKFRKENF